MKLIFASLASAIVASLVSATVVGQAQVTKTPSAVAFVSPTRILTESTYGRAEATRVQSIQQQKANDVRAKQQTLEATRQQLITSSDASERAQLQQREAQQRGELERATQQAQLELQQLQREVNTELQRRVRTALDDILKSQSYQLVLNGDAAMMWGAPELDLTAAVVGRMNTQ